MSPLYTVCSEGTFQYTTAGVTEFGDWFAEHGIDIDLIRTRGEHDDALAFCTQAMLANLESLDDVCDVDRDILMATMLSSDHNRALDLKRERNARKRRANFQVVRR